MKKILPFLVAIASLTFVTTVNAERVYQWENDQGITQFGSQPPRDREYQELRTHTGHSEPVDYRAQFGPEERQPTPTETEPEGGPSEEALERACRIARQNLETLERGGRIAEEDEDGQRRFLSEEELERRAKQARQTRDQAC